MAEQPHERRPGGIPFVREASNLVHDLDFRVAGKWLGLGALVGVAGGLGAILLQTLLQLLSGLFLGHLAGLPLEHPGGEPPLLELSPHPLVPWLLLLLPTLGGLASGVLVQRLAPEAAGAGADAAIRAYHQNRGLIRKPGRSRFRPGSRGSLR